MNLYSSLGQQTKPTGTDLNNKSMRLKARFVIFADIKRVYLFVGEGWRILPGVVGYGIFT